MDIDLCHPPQKTSSVLFHKHIFNTIDDAKQVLIDRCLGPGEMAAVRYGTRNEFGEFDDIHMILGIGGAVKNSGTDTYFFIDGESQNADVDLSRYYTKEEINDIVLKLNNDIESTYVTNIVFDEFKDNVVDEILNSSTAQETITNTVKELVGDEVVLKSEFGTIIQEYYALEDNSYDGGDEANEEWE